MSTPDTQFKLRIPAELKSRLEDHATASGRSLSAEIVHRLSEYLGSMGLRAQIAAEREMARSTVEMMDRVIQEMVDQRGGAGEAAAYPGQASGKTVDESIKDARHTRDVFQQVVNAADVLLTEIVIAEAKGEDPDVTDIRRRAKAWGLLSRG